MPIIRLMDREILYNGILVCDEKKWTKKWTIDTCNNIDESQNNYEWKKPDRVCATYIEL